MTISTKQTRATRVVTAILLVMGLLAVDAGSAAAGTRQELQRARDQYKQVQSRLNTLVEQYSDAKNKLTVTDRRIVSTKNEISEAESEVVGLQSRLKERVRTAYRMGGLGFVEFLFSAESFRDFQLRVMTLERQSSTDEGLILELRRVRHNLKIKQRDLEARRKQQAADRAALEAKVKGLNASMQEAQSVIKNLQAKLSREEQARLFRAVSSTRVSRGVSSGGGGRVISLAACPAAGPRTFSNDWGAPRGGGRRRHRGNDIFSPMGAPAAAVVSGRISRLRSGGLGGLSVYLWGDDGNEYYYAHMQSFKVSQGQRVSAGQTIATVGNTGNARGGSPHIHFEVHPGGGGAINPYYSLIRVC